MLNACKLHHAALIILGLMLLAPTAHALEGTAEQRQACAPDVFRLCQPAVPDVDKIVACMERQRESLSPACRTVFTPELLKNVRAARKQSAVR
jgi:hypothetical protein